MRPIRFRTARSADTDMQSKGGGFRCRRRELSRARRLLTPGKREDDSAAGFHRNLPQMCALGAVISSLMFRLRRPLIRLSSYVFLLVCFGGSIFATYNPDEAF